MEKTFDEKIKEKRADMLDKMSPQADKLMNDTRFSALRKPGVRKSLALLLLALCVTMPWTQIHRYWGIVAILGVFALWALLSKINRGFMDLPDELIDERIKARRNEIYRWSYLVAVFAMFAFVGLTIVENDAGTTISGTHPLHGFMGLTWTMFTLPTILFAFLEREL